MVNVRTKGAGAERDIADALNLRLYVLFKKLGMAVPPVPPIQRNQNQSAVGGSDLTNKLRLSIEVKRQEALSINTWWKQCVAAADRSGQIPVLIFKQNRQAWRVIMMAELPIPKANGSIAAFIPARVEISWEDFQDWFSVYAERLASEGVNLYAD